MKFLNFKTGKDEAYRLGLKTDKSVVDVAAAVIALAPQNGAIPCTLETLIASGPAGRAALAAFLAEAVRASGDPSWLFDEASLEIGPALLAPGKILCIGLNYRKHAEETGATLPTSPVIFSKFNNSIAAPGETIPLPADAEKYDHEVELAVVIGRRAQLVNEADALNYVLGYCTANDVSARDLQRRTPQWLLGKTLDKFMPIGPYLVTADEVGDPQQLGLHCWVNGKLRQNSNTADMIFGVAHLISYISHYFTLEPGDVILTGTPEGVIGGMKNPVWLKAGDEVVVEVEGLGKLSNGFGNWPEG